MKKFLIGLLAATGLSTPACASEAPANTQQPAAQTAAALPDADPAMWVVRDEDTTVYLFGTFHLLDGKTDWFNDEVRQAFDQSQELVFEIDMPEDQSQMAAQMQPLVGRYALNTSGTKLSSQLSAEQNQQLNAALATLGAPAGAFDGMKPWFVSLMLSGVMGQRLGLRPEHGAEMVLKRASAGRRPIGSVETLESQFQMLSSTPEEQQLKQLKEALDDLSKLEDVQRRMLAVWNAGDAEGMDRILNEGLSEDPAARRLLLGARNEKWAEWIDQRMDRPGTVFMAVGAGHLVGNDSVQTFLARRNIQSQRVPNLTPNR